MSEPPDNIDELLSGGRLSRPAQERVLGRVLAAVEAPARVARRKRILAIAFGTGTFATVTAAFLLFVGGSHPPSGPYLAAKGSSRSWAGAIEPVCESGSATCRVGERLFFRVDASESRRWLAIFAERSDEASPNRIWMFPGPDGVAPEIPPLPAAAILPRAVELAAELRPGLYRLTILIFNHPPSRDEAARGASASQRLFRALEIH
jgi:hypothetical protein